jgi:hypothetical protein
MQSVGKDVMFVNPCKRVLNGQISCCHKSGLSCGALIELSAHESVVGPGILVLGPRPSLAAAILSLQSDASLVVAVLKPSPGDASMSKRFYFYVILKTKKSKNYLSINYPTFYPPK